MATAIKENETSKELQRFSHDLFGFIWENYSLNSQSLAKAWDDMLKLHPRDDSGVIKHFDKDIGKAVLITQCLLREYCHFFIRYRSPDSLISEQIDLTIKDIIRSWTVCRNNVFMKIFDVAAIVAEVYLYCFEVLKRKLDLSCAHKMFSLYFQKKKRKMEFFKNGGWDQLRELALNDYEYFNSNLDRFVNFKNLTYGRLYYDCELVQVILNSDIRFPVEENKICHNCVVPTSNLKPVKFYCVNNNENENSDDETSNVLTSQQKDSSKFDPPQQESLKHDLPPEDALSLAMSKCAITKEERQVKKKIIKFFNCMLLKNPKSLEGTKLPENVAEHCEVKAEKSPKKKVNKKKKRKSKTKSVCEAEVKTDTSQATDLEAEVKTDTSQATDLEADISQDIKES